MRRLREAPSLRAGPSKGYTFGHRLKRFVGCEHVGSWYVAALQPVP